MIDRQFVRSLATVLAGVVVANEDLAPAKLYTRMRSPDHVGETNHRGRVVPLPRRHQVEIIRLKDFGLAGNHEDDGAPDVADVERFVIVVENEHRVPPIEMMVAVRVLFRFGVVQNGPLFVSSWYPVAHDCEKIITSAAIHNNARRCGH